MTETTTYWHIAHPTYTGGDLICRDTLVAEGIAPEWAWGEDAPEGFDGNVVCLFPDTEDGRYEADGLWLNRQDHVLVRVEIPADVHDAVITEVEEGFPAVEHRIPAGWTTVVARGYDAEVF